MRGILLVFCSLLVFFNLRAASHTTNHFSLKGTSVDSAVLVEVGDTLENNYGRITGALSVKMSQKITVNVYQDLKSFHTAIGMPGAPSYVVVASQDSSVIHMVSPDNHGTGTTLSNLYKILLGAFTQNCVYALATDDSTPIWLFEGTAMHYSRRLLRQTNARSLYQQANNTIPTLSDLTNNFSGNHGYDWSESFIQFVLHTYNSDSLRAFIKDPADYSILGAKDENELDSLWHDFVIRYYLTKQKITFQVDMREYTNTIYAVTVYGSFNNWCKTCDTLKDPDNDGIYVGTFGIYKTGAGAHDYKYVVYTVGGYNTEMFDSTATCIDKDASYYNRILVVNSDTTLPVVCYNKCEACKTVPEKVKVTLQVDMNAYASSFSSVNVYGNFNSWCNSCTSMSDADKDGVYDITLELDENYDLQWKFIAKGPDKSEKFGATDGCVEQQTGYFNRQALITKDTTLPAFCFNSCSTCVIEPEMFDVTFRLDMRNYTESFQKVYLSGTFNSWCGDCNELTDDNNDKVYELTLSFEKDAYLEWKYTLDVWSVEETLESGSVCTKTYGQYTNRFMTVTGDHSLDAVCWESCVACKPVGIAPWEKVLELFPNPNGGSFILRLEASGTTSVKISGMDGRVIYESSFTKPGSIYVPFSNVPPGTYLVEVLGDNLLLHRKVIVR